MRTLSILCNLTVMWSDITNKREVYQLSSYAINGQSSCLLFLVLQIFYLFLFLKVICFISLRMYGTKCTGCKTTIPANEFVMRALGNVYHIQCFVCTMCGHRLEKGQEFALKDNKLYCKDDYGKLPSKGSSSSPPHKQQQESKSTLSLLLVICVGCSKPRVNNLFPSRLKLLSQARPGAQTSIWNQFYFHMKEISFFYGKDGHRDPFWERGLR